VELKSQDSASEPRFCKDFLHHSTLKWGDTGFAFLPEYWSKGYAFESASAVLAHGRNNLGLQQIVGITTPDNHGSIRVLEKMGLKFEKMVKLSEDDIELKLFVSASTNKD